MDEAEVKADVARRIRLLRQKIEALLQEQSLNAKVLKDLRRRFHYLGGEGEVEPDTVDPQTKEPLAAVMGGIERAEAHFDEEGDCQHQWSPHSGVGMIAYPAARKDVCRLCQKTRILQLDVDGNLREKE